MENAELVGLSRQMTLRRQMDIVANNIANLNTTGFKGQSLQFEEYIMPVAEASDFSFRDRTVSYVQDINSHFDLTEGAMSLTDNPLDVAVKGQGWFVIDTENGEQYTRSGSFKIDQSGKLTTSDGQTVLGEGGPIVFSDTDVNISIAADGTISTQNGNRGRLRVVEFGNETALRHVAGNRFTGDGARPAAAAEVIQGALENSNVSGVEEMTRMIAVTRSYSAVASMMKENQDLREAAIRQLGTTNN
ncbi:MAG: flagellar basal-body rod protein FlgF [Stappiaceae bacterium]